MGIRALQAVGLDAGGSRTRCVVCLLEEEQIRLVGLGESPSAGWGKGRIADQAAVAESILAALREAEQSSQLSINSAVVGIGGASVRGANCRGIFELGRPREIEQRDVNRVMDRASRVQLQEDRMVLQMFPQDFVVDDHPGHCDPRNMLASRLEANVHLVTASIQEHNCLIGAVNQAHIEVEDTVFEPLAACYAAVLPEDRREGIALADIGAQSTGLAVYYGDSLQLATGLAISGDHFTRDVARGLHVSFEDAALVKQEYGCALAGSTAENSLIEVPTPENRERREAPRRLLNDILEARAEELFEHVKRELARVGMERALLGGIVLTGGGSRLPGMCDMAERVLGCQARNAMVIGIRDWIEDLDELGWATAAGLAMYAGKLKLQADVERQSLGLLGRILR